MQPKLCKDCKHCIDAWDSAFLITGQVSPESECRKGEWVMDARKSYVTCFTMRNHPLPEIYLPFGPGFKIKRCCPEGNLFEARNE